MKKEEKFLSILKKELHNNPIYNNSTINNSQICGLINDNSCKNELDNNAYFMDLNYKNEITELNESLEDLNFSDLDLKLNKVDSITNDSLNLDSNNNQQINSNKITFNNNNNNSKNIKLLNLIENTMTKVSSNFESITNDSQTKKLKNQKSKPNYLESFVSSKPGGINLQTPQKTQIPFISTGTGGLFSVSNKKNLASVFVDEKKVNLTTTKKTNKNLYNVNSRNALTKSTKK